MTDWLPGAMTLAGVIASGIGLEFTRKWLSRSADQAKVDADIRSEYKDVIQDRRQDAIDLKKDIETAEAKINALEKEIHEWREKYYKSYEDKLEVLAKLRMIQERLNRYESEE